MHRYFIFCTFSSNFVSASINFKLYKLLGKYLNNRPKHYIIFTLFPNSLKHKSNSKQINVLGSYFIQYSIYFILSLFSNRLELKFNYKFYNFYILLIYTMVSHKKCIFYTLIPKLLSPKSIFKCFKFLGINFIASRKYSIFLASSLKSFSDKYSPKNYKLSGSYLKQSTKYFMFYESTPKSFIVKSKSKCIRFGALFIIFLKIFMFFTLFSRSLLDKYSDNLYKHFNYFIPPCKYIKFLILFPIFELFISKDRCYK